MSDREANARRANRWTWACIALAAAGAVASSVSFGFILVAVLGMTAAWACSVWCVAAKGYTAWIALLGPFVAVALPSLHPVLDEIRRRESAVRDRSES